MWLILAFGSALFAGVTAILSKIGMKNIDSNLGTALRTVVVLVFTWIMVWIVGGYTSFQTMTIKNYIFIALSGLATGLSWLCYFKALQLGDVNKVVPIDKSSTVITMILAFLILQETFTWMSILSMICILTGTMLMIVKKQNTNENISKWWWVYALLSAVFASITSILAKMGMDHVDSNLATALRTIIVLIMAWVVVFVTKKQSQLKTIQTKDVLFIILSGVATGLSWLCYYKAIQDGNVSIVVPIDKLSIVVTIAFSTIFLKEKLDLKGMIGLLLIIVGTLLLIFF